MSTSTEMPTVQIRVPHGLTTVSAEIINDTWAITPTVGEDGRFLGRFAITHRETGYRLPGPGSCIGCARVTADLLAARNIIWDGNRLRIDGSDEPLLDAEISWLLAPVRYCEAEYCQG